LVTVGNFCFHFSRVLDSVVDRVNVSPSARVELNHALRDAQNVCALTKEKWPNNRWTKKSLLMRDTWLKTIEAILDV